MQIRAGYEIVYECSRPTPMNLMLNIHFTRVHDLVISDQLMTDPSCPVTGYRDSFGNWCSMVAAPSGATRLFTDALVNDSGMPDVVMTEARQTPVEALPGATIVFLLASRYCETDRMSELAWQLFAGAPAGWGRVQAICDFVHSHLTFGYAYARPTRTALEAYQERVGVCRDFAHLAITFCRCMNIPARYCTGYLGDIGVPPMDAPMDFSGWFEAYLDDRWYTFDARHNAPRIGRILIARGRDAADVAISTTFGPNVLKSFQVWTEEVPAR
jgi:transglutaminase-like putative cysteine protease